MNKRATLGGVLAISALFAFQISALTFAEDATDFSIIVNPSLSLRVSSSNVGFEITPSKTGVYDSASFSVYSSTNNSTGYTLTMSTSNVNLVSDTINPTIGDYPTIPTLTETQDGITAATFEASTDSTILNHYGVSIASSNYNAMKAEKEIKKTEENNIAEDTTVISLASKLDLNTVPGIYSTTINFSLTANPVDPAQPYPVDPCDSNPDCDSTSGVTLQRAYEMAYTAAHKGMYEETTPGSNTYQYIDSWNGGQYQGEGRDVRFLIQDMTPEICATATAINSQALVLDIRDQSSYYIVKAADGRCWMQDNLALNLLDSTVLGNLSTDNTNADSASLTSLRSGNRASGGQYATAGIADWTRSYSYSAPLINVSNKDVLPTTYNGSDEPLASIVTSESWKVGVYYNYCAASAGSYCYGNGTSGSITDSTAVDKPNTAIDAEYDICPSGWRMPTGYSYDATDRPDGGEYQLLANAITGDDSDRIDTEPEYSNIRKALRLPLSGLFHRGSADGQGSYDVFWSSTYDDSDYMYLFYIYTSYIYPQSSYRRYYGNSVRCINKTGTEPAPSGN